MIRRARGPDISAVTAIYADEVSHGTASFELEPPNAREMTRRFEAITQQGYPYYVATLDDEVVGYAYANQYRPRAAYRYTLESSVYVSTKARRRGVGQALLRTLLVACEDKGAHQIIAVIGDSGHTASIALHASVGFVHAGTLKEVGYKHGRWLDSVLMQLPLNT